MSFSLDEAKYEITANFPGIAITSIELIGEGFDHVAFIVNKNFIFRFTKSSISSGYGGSLEIENKLLPKLEHRLPVHIPHFEFFGKQKKNGFSFVGYKKISGDPLSTESFQQLSVFNQEKIIKKLADVITVFQNFPLNEAVLAGVQKVSFKERFQEDKEKMEKIIFPLVNRERQQYLDTLITSYLNTNIDVTHYCLLHADLWPMHLLCDAQTHQLTGIIDFGDVVIADRDYEFTAIYCGLGAPALDMLLRCMHIDKEKGQIIQKVQFFDKWNIVQDTITLYERNDIKKMKENLKIIEEFN